MRTCLSSPVARVLSSWMRLSTYMTIAPELSLSSSTLTGVAWLTVALFSLQVWILTTSGRHITPEYHSPAALQVPARPDFDTSSEQASVRHPSPCFAECLWHLQAGRRGAAQLQCRPADPGSQQLPLAGCQG